MAPIPPPPTSLQTIVAMREEGFESDAPVGGTIKRKPSTVLSPKIPLTLNTRSLVSDYITAGEGNTVTLAHTLQRKRSSSGTPSTCSSNSSSVSSPVSHPLLGKPPQGPPVSFPKVPTLSNCGGEETLDSLEIANLPPPPPELLEYGGCDEVNVVSINETTQPENVYPKHNLDNRPSSILKAHPAYAGGALPPAPLRQPSIENGSITQSLPKKGVTFANELSQRLMSRNHVGPDNVNGFNKMNSGMCPSSPKKLEEPPQDFLCDLQRVMQKKWQVAQKCHVSNTSPQEILGFRFEPTGQEPYPDSPMSEECQSENGDTVNPATLNNVRAWVSQHYGGVGSDESEQIQPRKPIPPVPNAKPQQRVTFSIPPVASGIPSPPCPQPPLPPPIYQAPTSVVIYENFQGRKQSVPHGGPIIQMNSNYNHHQQPSMQYQVHLRNKKPPPPIPKRADSTHLSAHFVYN